MVRRLGFLAASVSLILAPTVDAISGLESRPSCDSLSSWQVVPPVFIPLGQESHTYFKEDLPVKACIRERAEPPWWAKPFVVTRLRIAHAQLPPVDSKKAFKLWKLSHTFPKTDFCEWWTRNFRLHPFGFCDDCESKSCNLAASLIPGSPDYHIEMAWPDPLSSGSDSCVCLGTLPPNARSMTVSWEDNRIDPLVLVCLLVGLGLMRYYYSIRESPSFHAALGGVTALILWSIAFAWWILRNVRKTATGVPIFGGLFSLSFAFAFASFPSLRSMLNPFQSLPVFKSWITTILSLQDPFGYNLPIGWIMVLVFLFVGLIAISYGARWSMSFFASPADPEGEIEFYIGSDGRRVDILPPRPWSQTFLGWWIRLVGVIIVSRSTYSSICSLILIGLGFDLNFLFRIASFLVEACSFRSGLQPNELRQLLSEENYESQKRECTLGAVRRLREHIRAHPGVFAQMRDDQSELRLRRFSEDGSHVRKEALFDENPFSRNAYTCTVL